MDTEQTAILAPCCDTLDRLQSLARDSTTLEIDVIRQKLEPIFRGMFVETPIFDPGTFVYRARRIDHTFNPSNPMTLADLSYPPPNLAGLNRANRSGHPMFYCSTGKEPVFFELGSLNAGDEIILSSWRSKSKMFVNNIGYTEAVFNSLGAARSCPAWKAAPASLPPDVMGMNDKLRGEISRLFAKEIGPDQRDEYRLTAAIAEAHLGSIANADIRFAGILYPSVRMFANGDNLALLPEFVDAELEFRRATRIRFERIDGPQIDITNLDCAREVNPDGTLKWLGRQLVWTLQPGQKARLIVTAGCDDDGEYSSGKEGQVHWVLVDASSGIAIPMS